MQQPSKGGSLMEKVDYSKRIKTLRNEITKAETVIEIKQRELKEIKATGAELQKEIKEKYDIPASKLQELHDQKLRDLEEKLEEAETKLQEIKSKDESE